MMAAKYDAKEIARAFIEDEEVERGREEGV